MKMLFLALMLSTTGFAAEKKLPGLCASLKSVDAQVRDCEDNDVFSQAAVACLRRLEKEIKDAKASLGLSEAVQSVVGQSAQAKMFSAAGTNYADAGRKLDRLLQMGAQSIQEVMGYRQRIAWPEDWDEPEAVGNDLDAYLASSSCYQDAKKNLEGVVASMDEHMRSLAQARLALRDQQGLSGAREVGQGAVDPTKAAPLKAPKAVAPVPTVKGKNWNASDISGTEEKKE